MGLFDFFSGKKSEKEVKKGTFAEVEIVGESFQKEAFKIIRDKLGKSSDSEATVKVELRNEKDNPHAKNGKAVAAYVMGEKLGYVSSYTAEQVFDLLELEQGSRTLSGRVYFGDLRENPPKNSLSISLSVEIKTAVETAKYEEKYQKVQQKREINETARDEFLANPEWSNHALKVGDSVTFTGFKQWDDLPKLSESILGEKSKAGVNLLVVHPSIQSDSAKLRDWLAKKRPVTNLNTFVENNPDFAKYFNRTTNEFDVPGSISGKKPIPQAPPTKRVFESDTNLSAPAQRMPTDLVLLPEQTLATYPSFTIYGHLNWRLSDLKNYKTQIEGLFNEVDGKKTDSILIKGKLEETQIDGETRIEFIFRGQGIALVPKNETQGLLRDGGSWTRNAALAIIGWDFKNNFKGEHDCGLTEGYFLW